MTHDHDPLFTAAQATNQSNGRGWDFSSPHFHEPFNWRLAAPVIVAVVIAVVGLAMCGVVS